MLLFLLWGFPHPHPHSLPSKILCRTIWPRKLANIAVWTEMTKHPTAKSHNINSLQ